MPHVVLSPDGTQEVGLAVIVEARTGVTYEQQCGGYATLRRTLEGFYIPLGGPLESRKIYGWFWATFGGRCYTSKRGNPWTPETTEMLQKLVSEVPCWLASANGNSEVHHLQLDLARMTECIEAWIPVLTPYGRGILTLANSD